MPEPSDERGSVSFLSVNIVTLHGIVALEGLAMGDGVWGITITELPSLSSLSLLALAKSRITSNTSRKLSHMLGEIVLGRFTTSNAGPDGCRRCL